MQLAKLQRRDLAGGKRDQHAAAPQPGDGIAQGSPVLTRRSAEGIHRDHVIAQCGHARQKRIGQEFEIGPHARRERTQDGTFDQPERVIRDHHHGPLGRQASEIIVRALAADRHGGQKARENGAPGGIADRFHPGAFQLIGQQVILKQLARHGGGGALQQASGGVENSGWSVGHLILPASE